MKKFSRQALSIVAPGVLVFSLAGCSDDRAEHSDSGVQGQAGTEQAAGQGLEEREQTMQTQAGLYGAGQGEQDQALAATVHRTITFAGDSTELDDMAEQSLERMAESLNEDLSTQVTVRTVDANDVSQSDASGLNDERVETVKKFLEEKGVNVADIRLDRYDAREFVDTQAGSQHDESDVQTESPEMVDGRDDQQQAEQDVVITIVSGAHQ